jgi:hypothetical protein
MKEWLPNRNQLAAIGGLGVLHAVVCWGLFRITLLNTLARAETGRLPSAFESKLQTASDLLMFPFLQLSAGPRWFQMLHGLLPLTLTSLLWGLAIYLGYRGLGLLVQHLQRPRRAR